MESVICTLFESHYHLGVAALVNSLCEKGYKGDIYAGYFGKLPDWAKIEKGSSSVIDNSQTFLVNDGVKIHFIPLTTDYHLANYKPNFMKWLLEGPAKHAENIFYFDPDIVLNYQWSFYEEWVNYGIAVCEDVNSPLSLNHPRKMAWFKYFGDKGIDLKFKENIYANSGFVGVNRKDKIFLDTWINIQELIAPLIGGLSRSPFPGDSYLSEEHSGDYAPFSKTDQDALNVTIGTWDGNVSMVGKEGMAIQSGPALMFHALGRPKPWESKFLWLSLTGCKPRRVDKVYWKSVSTPIKLYSDAHVFRKNASINFAVLISRLYTRN